MINGQPITVRTQPNQEIDLPGGVTVIINEQSGNSSVITMNALHVTVPKDFVTGAGWIVPVQGSRASFAIAGGIKNGGYWGHLQYSDHGPGMKVKGTGITASMIVDGTLRHIEGTCEIDGKSGYTFKADVADNAEPGWDADTFSITLSNCSGASGKLAGGNIQLFPARKRIDRLPAKNRPRSKRFDRGLDRVARLSADENHFLCTCSFVHTQSARR